MIIPGVSAGTMAWVTSLYPLIISAFSAFSFLALRNKREFIAGQKDFRPLIPVFLGAVIGFYINAQWVSFLIKEHPAASYSVFSGIIIAEAPFLHRDVKGGASSAAVTAVFAVLTFCFSFLGQSSSVFEFFQEGFPKIGWQFLAVYLAVGAMLLPGLSGSYILIIMGVYSDLLEELKSFSFLVVLYAFIGCFSLITVSKWIRYLFQRKYAVTMSVLTGMTLGGGAGIFPIKTCIQEERLSCIVFLAVGAGAVWFCRYLSGFFKVFSKSR